jgi:magnesium chelatase accessory protein
MRILPVPQDWPHKGASETIEAGGVAWHVQRFGTGPALLLIHGTAASTHSFRSLADQLADDFEVIMVDLPGHGFSSPLDAPSLPRVAEAMGALIRKLGVSPALVAGHSAGAAVAIRMALDGWIDPSGVIGLAPALKPYGGSADGLASRLAKLVFFNPIAPRVLALQASEKRVSKLLGSTGSRLDPAGTDYYVRLFKRPEHLAGALRLMANWNLRPLLEDLPQLAPKLTLIVGDRDKATPVRDAEQAARLAPHSEIIRLTGFGHLAHEEAPERAAEIIRQAAAQQGLITDIAEDAPLLEAAR